MEIPKGVMLNSKRTKSKGGGGGGVWGGGCTWVNFCCVCAAAYQNPYLIMVYSVVSNGPLVTLVQR